MIYLASPYTHADPEVMEARYNAVAAETANLLKQRLIVYSPIVHCHHLAKDYGLPTHFHFWQVYNFGMLYHATEFWFLKLEGYEDSVGMGAEAAFAATLGKPIKLGEWDGKDYRYV